MSSDVLKRLPEKLIAIREGYDLTAAGPFELLDAATIEAYFRRDADLPLSVLLALPQKSLFAPKVGLLPQRSFHILIAFGIAIYQGKDDPLLLCRRRKIMDSELFRWG